MLCVTVIATVLGNDSPQNSVSHISIAVILVSACSGCWLVQIMFCLATDIHS
jgi:hypothetical protein